MTKCTRLSNDSYICLIRSKPSGDIVLIPASVQLYVCMPWILVWLGAEVLFYFAVYGGKQATLYYVLSKGNPLADCGIYLNRHCLFGSCPMLLWSGMISQERVVFFNVLANSGTDGHGCRGSLYLESSGEQDGWLVGGCTTCLCWHRFSVLFMEETLCREAGQRCQSLN